MTASPAGGTSRSPGRPRSARAEAAILDATLELLAVDGLALTVEAIAQRAGVGKATVYRRWPGKEDLVVEALSSLKHGVRGPLSGELRADLIACVEGTRVALARTIAGRLLPHVMATASAELQQLYWDRVVAPQRRVVTAVLLTAVAAGEIVEPPDIELLIDLLVGPAIIRSLLGAVRSAATPLQVEVVVDTVLTGLRPR